MKETLLSAVVLPAPDIRRGRTRGEGRPGRAPASRQGPETSAFLTWQYHLLAGASYFQQSWDQAALPSETQAIYSAVSKLFAGELTGQQFASALNG